MDGIGPGRTGAGIKIGMRVTRSERPAQSLGEVDRSPGREGNRAPGR